MAAQFKANQRVLIESVQNQNEAIAAQLQAHKQLLADRFKDLRDKGSPLIMNKVPWSVSCR